MTRLLIVDDDKELSAMLVEYLSSEGFDIDTAYHGLSAIEKVKGQQYDALILDVMMPELDGFGVLRHIRSYSDVPVLMLTAKGDDVDRIVGLEMGADDYLSKPFNPRELLARVRAVLRRSIAPSAPEVLDESLLVAGLEMDMRTRLANANGALMDVTSTEFNLLYLLLRQVGHVVTKEMLSQSAMGRSLEKYDRSIDMHMSNLRKKLSEYGLALSIVTVRGQGYQLVEG
ncbi:MAG: response regulator transcription factor [Piscirickettsiaceae bacterium]|jgi:DNA-binding response OmpR family regulator|nr:response regulator transcription factor [Piscirickettsiaceae bacterium]